MTRTNEPERTLRRALLLVLTLGMIGSAAELLLLGHTEDAVQWVPLVALATGLQCVVFVALRPGPTSVRVLRAVMALFVVAGAVGLVQHYRGNVEFELEMYPSMSGLELFRNAMTGATPALAPGTMILLGLVGLTYCLRHPILEGPGSEPGSSPVP